MSQNRPKFTFLGHNTVRCDFSSGETMLINPWVEHNPACPSYVKEFNRLDAMLITNGNFDSSADAVSLARKYRPLIVGTGPLCQWLEDQGIKKETDRLSSMNIGGTQRVLNTEVTQVQALHTSISPLGVPILHGDVATGFVVRLLDSGYTFYYAGPTGLFSDMKLIGELYRPNLAFLPIGNRFTMGPMQAAHACKYLNVPQVIPIHWGSFPTLTGQPDQLINELNKLGVNCETIVLSPGESY